MQASLPTITSNLQADEAVNRFIFAFISLSAETSRIVDDARRFPESPLLQIYAGLFHLHFQIRPAIARAARYFKRAEELPMSPLEKSLLYAAGIWQQGHHLSALAHFEKHCRTWPTDIASLKVTEFLYYCTGQKHFAERFLDLCQYCYPYHRDNAHFLSIYSFALELAGDYFGSRAMAEKSIELDPKNPWAYHTLSHYYINTGDIAQGIRILSQAVPCWKNASRPIESHNFWHLALLHLENLDFDSTLTIYKNAEWDKKVIFIGEEIDAAALLWRLDMYGKATPMQWKTLAESIGSHANFPVTPFNSVHLLYALKRGGREDALAEAISKTRDFIEGCESKDRFVWKTVGEPLIEGSLAFAEENYAKTAELLRPIIPHIASIGGSDAQVALFEQTYLTSLIRSRQHSTAKIFCKNLFKDVKPTLRQQELLASCS